MAIKAIKPVKNAEPKKITKKAAPKDVRNDRYFVIDTSVLLHDSNSLFAFKGVVIVIPLVVLEELDTFKTDRGEKGRNAREIIRTLDDLRSKGHLNEGVPLNHDTGSILRVLPTPMNASVFEAFCSNTVDNQIIAIVQNLTEQGYKTTLVTKDINARVKTNALELDAEDYLKGVVTLDQFYKGWKSYPMSPFEIKGMSEKKLSSIIMPEELTLNEFVILESSSNSLNNRIYRYLGGSSFKEVMQPQLGGWDFHARNIQQLMAFDLLMDDSVKIVTLLGPAGTGKTFIALLVGLYKVMKMHLYRKFLISRPVVALGADIGYLPGDVQEKLFHWMGPVYDNLEFIFSHMNRATAEATQELGEKSKDRRHRKRFEERNNHHGNGGHHSKHHEAMPAKSSTRADIDRLQDRGILSLEAITYMRGRSIPNQFVFIDEVQNLTPHEVKTIVSRAGEGTKVILAGDPYQIDSPYLDFTSNGLTVTSEKFKNHEIFGTAFLETSERSELAKLAAAIL